MKNKHNFNELLQWVLNNENSQDFQKHFNLTDEEVDDFEEEKYDFIKDTAINVIEDMMNGFRTKDTSLNLPDIDFETYSTSDEYQEDYDNVRYIVEENINNYL